MNAQSQPIDAGRGIDKDRAVLLMLRAYAIVTPLFIFHLNDDVAVGGPDLMFFPAVFMLFLIRRLWIDLAGAFYLVFVLFALISVLHVAEGTGGLVRVLSVARVPVIFMPYLIALQVRRWSLEDMRVLLGTFVVSGGAAVLIGIVLHVFGIEVKEGTQRLWFEGGSLARAAGLTGNTADYGHMVALWYAATVIYASRFMPRAGPALIGVAVAISAYAFTLSSSRAAALNILVFTVFALIPVGARLLTARSIVTGAGLIVVAAIAATLADGGGGGGGGVSEEQRFVETSVDRFNVFSYLESDLPTHLQRRFSSGRLENWPILVDLILQRPIMGYGYKQISATLGIPTDNSLLAAMVDTGVLGGAAFFGFWAWLLLKGAALSARAGLRYLLYFGFVVANFAHALTIDLFSIWYSMPMFLLLSRVVLMTLRAESASERAARGD